MCRRIKGTAGVGEIRATKIEIDVGAIGTCTGHSFARNRACKRIFTPKAAQYPDDFIQCVTTSAKVSK